MAEHDDILALLLLFILVFAALIVINSVDKITGLAVLDTQENVQSKVEQLVNKLSFLNLVDEASFCLLIKMDDTTTYSYNIDKLGSIIDVSDSSNLYCNGMNNEDFVFSYVSYAAFLEHAQGSPILDDFKKTGDGTNFYVLPSRYIEKGMFVKNRADFELNYGAIFDQFTAIEREQFLTGTAPEAREPRGFSTGLILTIVGLVVIVILIILLLPKITKQPEIGEELELITYIKSALAKGHEEEDIKASLIGSGWPEEEVKKAFTEAKPEVATLEKPAETKPTSEKPSEEKPGASA